MIHSDQLGADLVVWINLLSKARLLSGPCVSVFILQDPRLVAV